MDDPAQFFLLPSLCCCCCVASVVSDSVRPHRRQPTRLSIHGIFQQEYWSGLPLPSQYQASPGNSSELVLLYGKAVVFLPGHSLVPDSNHLPIHVQHLRRDGRGTEWLRVERRHVGQGFPAVGWFFLWETVPSSAGCLDSLTLGQVILGTTPWAPGQPKMSPSFQNTL